MSSKFLTMFSLFIWYNLVMSEKSISILVGAVLILSVGVFVYKTKNPPVIPVETLPSTNTETTTPEPVTIPAQKTPAKTNPVTTTKETPASSTPSGITLAQVALHNSSSSCWSAINGNVYDLTSWIHNHPGGEKTILSICGIDGTSRYSDQHGGSSRTAKILEGFKLGLLVS